jgi:hypothetical protein
LISRQSASNTIFDQFPIGANKYRYDADHGHTLHISPAGLYEVPVAYLHLLGTNQSSDLTKPVYQAFFVGTITAILRIDITTPTVKVGAGQILGGTAVGQTRLNDKGQSLLYIACGPVAI